ncbi:hypothetical protein F4560_004424 [Saccharothrix ecbatanensis]|uniref:Uncharacterized protein n=1 Tax=Saccharothrix ecbatanensis TaxID=1105145 RepID=A0A7W9M278_9PSEU|nr:phage tail tube protein [Saccharothrix ecbatanensis]MBB5804656.1 hypothetical protein [Saccharothrix ecbatanensis]
MFEIANIIDGYVGTKDEVTYGTPVAVNKFYVFNSETVEGDYSNVIMSAGLKAGEYTVNSERVARNPKGASGNLELEFDNQGFAFWLKHMLGSVTTGATALGVTEHTFKLGDTAGKSFTLQKKLHDSEGNAHIMTYQGGKVTEWELSNSVDNFLMLNLGLDFQKENVGAGAGPLAAQTPTYPTGVKTFKFFEGSVTVGGSTREIIDVSLKGNKNLKTDRYYINGTGLKKEPKQNGHDELTIEFTAQFEDLDDQLRVAAAGESDAQAEVVLTWTATEAEAGGGLSTLTITLPVVSFTSASTTIDGIQMLEQTVSGNVLWPANSGQGDNPITVVLLTPDTTA